MWHRSSLDLAGIVPFDDWVFGLASRGDHLLAGVTSRLHVLDTATLKPLKTLCHQVCNHVYPLQNRCASSLLTTLNSFETFCHQADLYGLPANSHSPFLLMTHGSTDNSSLCRSVMPSLGRKAIWLVQLMRTSHMLSLKA